MQKCAYSQAIHGRFIKTFTCLFLCQQRNVNIELDSQQMS